MGLKLIASKINIQSKQISSNETFRRQIYFTMPYLIVRESYINNSCIVDGLPLNEVRLITEKSSSPSNLRDERNWRVEFSTEAYNLLNALEQIGYKVVTSSSFVTGPKKFDTKDFIWTLYRPSKCDIEM